MMAAAAAMSKPLFFSRSDHSSALDIFADRYGRNGGSSSRSRTKDFVFVVNPNGANGRTGREWKKLLPYLRQRLDSQCNICESITSGRYHAVDITREAIRNGADAVIAVGGDGTLHEVVNGFFWKGNPLLAIDQGCGHSTTLGLIPLGTGSDFARTFGWKNDPYDAVERIVKGLSSNIDVGLITANNGERHVFINVADIHLSAKAGYYASKYKRFGKLCYVIGALRSFIGHDNVDVKIKVDGGEWELCHKVTAVCIGNAKYFGGGMKITPTANPTSGAFEVVILQDFKWYDFVFKLHKLYTGTHLSEQNVSTGSVKSIEIVELKGKGDVYVQSDGEHLGFLPAKCSILPSAVSIMKMLDHPNIVKLFEVIDDPNTDNFYMVLEYVENKCPLEGSSPRGGIGESTSRRYLRDVVAGLMYLHAHNIIHGDLKPDNLLVTSNGNVKIADFSVSQVFEDDNDELRRSPGTPVFTAPECCLGSTYRGRSADTWALGVTLYCLIFGQYPFLGDTLQDTYDKIVNNPLSLPHDLNPQLKNLLEGLLCKDPKHRITLPSVAEHPWVVEADGPIPEYLCQCRRKSSA